MDPRKTRTAPPPVPPHPAHDGWPSLFLRQPPRVLIVEARPPWWAQTGPVLCEALDNFLSLACSVAGPCRVPLISMYAVSRQQECLLPFVPLSGNQARLRCCVEELRSLPGDGCTRAPPRGGGGGGELLRQAVLDSLQQFNQYTRHMSAGRSPSSNSSLEVTVVTSQPGRAVVRLLEAGLRGVDLLSLRRLLVVEISAAAGDWGHDAGSPEDRGSGDDESLMLGTELDLQRVENSTVAVETVLKSWLQAQGGDREHLDLILPGNQDRADPVCLKCDVQERLISPALLPLALNIGPKTESPGGFPPPPKGPANQSPPPMRLIAVKTLRVEGVCESLLYGQPMVVQPTSCWKLDWDQLESNHQLFHALCHTLRSRDVFLLVRSEAVRGPAAPGPGLHSHFLLQASPSLSLLLKPVVSREQLLPCPLPVCTGDPQPSALHAMQGSLAQLDEDGAFNPLSVTSNLYQHLRNQQALLSRPKYPYRAPQAARRELPPPDGAKASHTRQPRQQGRHLGPQPTNKVRATVAPLPSSSSSSSATAFAPSQGPPLCKAPRPALTFLRGGEGRPPAGPRGPRVSSYAPEEWGPRSNPAPHTAEKEEEEEEEEDFLLAL